MNIWNDIATTGTIGKFDGIHYKKVSDSNRYNRHEIVRTVEDEQSNWGYIWDPKFIPEFISNAGYSTAAVATGGAAAATIKGTAWMASSYAAKGVSTAAQIARANKIMSNIARAEKIATAYIPPIVAGQSEGITNVRFLTPRKACFFAS